MADEVHTSERFHTELTNLLADIVARAIRGDAGLQWEDAAKVIELVHATQRIRFVPAADLEGTGEFKAYACVGFDGEDADIEASRNLSAILLDWCEDEPEVVREYRDYIAVSVKTLDDWLADREAK